MARIRTIKPEFFRHEELFDAEKETGLPLRLAFVSLWTVADREGRFKWRPRALKTDCLPYDDVDFSRVLDALSSRGFIVRYECAGETYGCIPSFTAHQVINNRESASTIPDPKDCNELTREGRVDDASTTPLVPAQEEGKGREGNREEEGKESSSLRSEDSAPQAVASRKRKPSASIAQELPDDWQPDRGDHDYAEANGFSADLFRKSLEDMKLWAKANRIRKHDWHATFKGFMRRDSERQAGQRAGPNGNGSVRSVSPRNGFHQLFDEMIDGQLTGHSKTSQGAELEREAEDRGADEVSRAQGQNLLFARSGVTERR